jgi:Leucine-rich repeat (LRR) protein
MKQLFLPLLLSLLFFARPLNSSAQTANQQDSLALVDLYNSTNGPGWLARTNWLSPAPISTWYGVVTSGEFVVNILLAGNRMVGSLPSSLGNLSKLQVLQLSSNQLIGSIPASFKNFPGHTLDLSNNQLSGDISPILNLTQNPTVDLQYNRFTFAGTDIAGANMPNKIQLANQADIPLITNGNTLSIAAGGTLSNNTYAWYKDGANIATQKGDSTFITSSPGIYSVQVTNSIVSGLTLYSISSAARQDSLALVDLYTATWGFEWTNSTNWMTTAPLSTWYGVTVRNSRVQGLKLTGNNLIGNLTPSIGNLTGLVSLDLTYNQLSGPLQPGLAQLSSLNVLSLGQNRLNGNLPSWLGNLPLSQMNLYSNQFTGQIPSSIANNPLLFSIDLSYNQLIGGIPASLGNLTRLSWIRLSNNQLSDTIPASFGNCSSLWVLDCSYNQLTGNIPATLGRLDSLWSIDLHGNRLSGPIPDSFFACRSLIAIYLSNNHLTGKLPDSVVALTHLANLDLHNNELNGPAPSGFKSTFLINNFNIQNNHFNFSGMEDLVLSGIQPIYSPQATIPLHQKGDSIYVSAGGTPKNDTFVLYKNGVFVTAQGGDSAFKITGAGKYNVISYNTIATLLTLYSDTLNIIALLPDSTITASQPVTGSQPTDLNNGIFKLVTLTPTPGPDALSGNVTAIVTMDTAISTFNSQPYVQRHYDITPTDNAATAQATVTLYFTQQDFDAYNTYATTHNLSIPLLPVNGIDNGNIHLTQYHGMFSSTANPANYTQGSTVILPTVAWDATNNWWAVSFPVTGFSGFFLSSNDIPLPLTLLQFTGVLQGNSVNLQWRTTNELNTSQFVIQRSSDGLLFSPVGTAAARSTPGANRYTFTDNDPVKGNNFYQLKMIDIDGHYTYSPIIKINADISSAAFYTYPNPARNTTSLLFNAGVPGKYSIEVTDLSGKKMSRLTGTSIKGLNKVDIDLHAYAAGIYTLTITDEEHSRRTLQLRKE